MSTNFWPRLLTNLAKFHEKESAQTCLRFTRNQIFFQSNYFDRIRWQSYPNICIKCFFFETILSLVPTFFFEKQQKRLIRRQKSWKLFHLLEKNGTMTLDITTLASRTICKMTLRVRTFALGILISCKIFEAAWLYYKHRRYSVLGETIRCFRDKMRRIVTKY
jgi:hypothetical protein